MGIFRRRHYRETLLPRPLPGRQRSKAATWSLRLAAFAPVLAVVAIVAHRAGMIQPTVFVALATIVFIVAVCGVALAMVAFHSLWWKGKKGGRATLWAIVLSIVTLSPFIAGGYEYLVHPAQADVSTDLVNPPLFSEEERTLAPNASAVVAGRLSDGYPSLTGRRYNAPPDAIRESILKVADDFGWLLVDRRGRIGADDEIYFEFSDSAPVIGMPGRVVLRLTDEGDTSYLDVRARTDYLSHDLGGNARMIDRYLKALDYELIGIVEK